MNYDKSKNEPFLQELFRNPTKEYRGAPFWAWNCKMTKDRIDQLLNDFKTMGMGGAYIHSRTGMDLPYLGDEFMEMVRYSFHKSKELGLLTYLYDEDRWPSGFGGGLVTKDDCYRSRFIVFSPTPMPLNEDTGSNVNTSSAEAVSSGRRKFLAAYHIKLSNGFLEDYKRVYYEYGAEQERLIPEEGWDDWYAYLEISGDSAWFNNESYVNTLDEKAIARFIEITYDAYYNLLGEEFGKDIPAIFTDEPQFSLKSMFGFADDKKTQTVPYTDDFEDSYQITYGESFLDSLPEIFWDLPDLKVSLTRYRYHDHVCERFTRAFADQVGMWCRNHNILLTGHMMNEPYLESQTNSLGEAMRSYRGFGVPGIDILCGQRELTTAKQAQSAVHQFDYPGMVSEIYGVTNWNMDFRRHKIQGDWQAALGVTCRVHHLTWSSMAGEGKRDYPASIGYQSPWYKEYRYIEDYFSRINTVLTRGKAKVKVGVIHPIESYWLYWGTKENTYDIRKEMEEMFITTVKWLLYGLIDFDFISESLLEDFTQQEGTSGFQVGSMKYDTVIVPNLVTMRRNTLDRLSEFAKQGGTVIIAGRIPEYVDAKPSDEPLQLAKISTFTGFYNIELLNLLSKDRLLDIRNHEGIRTNNLIYQLREEGDEQWLFISHSEDPASEDLAHGESLTIHIKGIWNVEKLIPETGEIERVDYYIKNGDTYIKEVSYDYDSFMYHLMPSKGESRMKADSSDITADHGEMWKEYSGDKVPIVLEEDNVCLLDQAEYCMDDGDWNEKEEILRIDNIFRRELGCQSRTDAIPQPWLLTSDVEPEHSLKLRFTIESQIALEQVSLALEDRELVKVFWNGNEMSRDVIGWYVDKDIKKIALTGLKEGINLLEVIIPFHKKANVEAMYLLGDFGVCVTGRTSIITEPVRELAFGDICTQGLPFYGGNISYRLELISKEDSNVSVEVSGFRCPVIKGILDGEDKGLITTPPYRLEMGKISGGSHELILKAYGNRVNTFGAVHNFNKLEEWVGPMAWRSSGTSWSYEYRLKPTGILKSPRLKFQK